MCESLKWYPFDMVCPLAWELPLDLPPEVVNVGRNAHGYEPSDRFRLRDLWSLHLYGYAASLRLDGTELAIRPGMLGITPPGTLMEYRYRGVSIHVYAHFRLSPGVGPRIEALQELGPRYDNFYERLYDCVGLFARHPRRVEARLWDLLWEAASLSGGDEPEEGPLHPAVRRACDMIERHLAEPLSVAQLAVDSGVSPAYLARLFQADLGDSVIGYIRRRRMERADAMLRRSTLPIKEIAFAVGIPDLQHFNKAVRAHFGVGPREWRSRG